MPILGSQDFSNALMYKVHCCKFFLQQIYINCYLIYDMKAYGAVFCCNSPRTDMTPANTNFDLNSTGEHSASRSTSKYNYDELGSRDEPRKRSCDASCLLTQIVQNMKIVQRLWLVPDYAGLYLNF